MFTGIVSAIGVVREMRGTTDRELVIEPSFDPRDLALGASVAHAGICLTVTEIIGGAYLVQASAETLARTTLGHWTAGRRVDLERSLRLGDELGGHLVFGHVDAVAAIAAIEESGASWRFAFAFPPAEVSRLAPLVAVKGSIAVDGISLTVTEAGRDGFAVMVIPHTHAVTTLADRRIGDHVNIEVDMLARYVARRLAFPTESLVHAD